MDKNNGFSAVEAVIVVVVLAVIGALGWVYFNRPKDEPKNDTAKTSQTETKKASEPTCKGDKAGSDGYFCLEGFVSLPVPKEFGGKFAPVAGLPGNTKYQAVATEDKNGTYTMTLSKEKAYSGDIDFPYELQSTTYDSASGELRTNMTKKLVPTITINEQKFFHGTLGDAGVTRDIYLTDLGAYFIRAELRGDAYMGPGSKTNPTIRLEDLQTQFEAGVKQLTIL